MPIAIVNWTASAEGTDDIEFSTSALYGWDGNNLVSCPGPNCLGATVQKLCGGSDFDGDGVPDTSDQCPNTPSGSAVDANGCSQTQVDQDSDGAYDPDKSSPQWCTGSDNCPTVVNPDQKNSDGNGPSIIGSYASNPAQDRLGDACDSDNDNDGLTDTSDLRSSSGQ